MLCFSTSFVNRIISDVSRSILYDASSFFVVHIEADISTFIGEYLEHKEVHNLNEKKVYTLSIELDVPFLSCQEL